MTNNVFVMNIASIVLHCTLIGLIYFLLWKVLSLARHDLQAAPAQALAETEPPQSLTAWIEVMSATEDAPGKIYRFAESLSIGRSDKNDVVINDAFVSSEHVCLTLTKHGCLLTDLASTNGTYVNDQKVDAETVLNPGDRISIGPVTFKFER